MWQLCANAKEASSLIMRHRSISTAILTIALLGLLIPLAASASDGSEWVGTISSRPTGTIGDWTIGGRSFSAGAATRIQQEHGLLAAGACAEVKYYIGGTSNIATLIDSQPAYKCSGSGSGSGDSGSGSGSGDSGSGSGDSGSGSGSSGDSSHRDSYALVAQFPAGLVGGWVIGGANYTSTTATRIEQQNGTIAVGTCVEIKFSAISGVNTALEIDTVPTYKCDGTAASPATSRSQIYGVLGTVPSPLVGTWDIGGVSYTATTATRFEQERGPFFSGGCVDVKFQPGTTNARESGSTDAYRCGTAGTQPVAYKIYGLVEVAQASSLGVWTIGGGQYTATSATRFNTEHGTLNVGTCATVEYSVSGGVNTAVRIGSEEPTKCNTSTYRNKIYGQISAMPSGLYGTWTISGQSISANATTSFEQSGGALAVNGCAEASYYVQNGVSYAEKIESRAGCASGTTPSLLATSKAYAVIDSLPAVLGNGTWGIGGVSYSANAATVLSQEAGVFAVGACVEARYATQSGVNTLLKVETKPATRCQQVGGAPVLRAYGAIEALPSPAGAGDWRVSGVNYSATSSTLLRQEQGFFAIGAYVEVTYQISGVALTALSIQTHVAPGDGRSVVVGHLDTRPSDDTGTWMIDGVAYQGDPAINVDLGSSGLTSLAASTNMVQVISYRGLSGVQYITSIVAAPKRVYVPLIVR